MAGRPRIDLDGVALADERDETMVLAIFRYRTTDGLVLLMPESGEFLVGWDRIADAQVDLQGGSIRVAIAAPWAASQGWLRGATVLVGSWTDRMSLDAATVLGDT